MVQIDQYSLGNTQEERRDGKIMSAFVERGEAR